MAATVKVKVKDGWAVYDGTEQRNGGGTVDTDSDTAKQWVTVGWA